MAELYQRTVSNIRSSPHQNRNAKLLGVCQLLPGFHPLARESCSPWHANRKRHAITGINAAFLWGVEQQKVFNNVKIALIEATALAQPDSEAEFVLNTDASGVAMSGILHRRPGPPESRKLCPIIFGSKKLTTTQAKYGAQKLEMYAAHHFIL